jgi:hypothetical protein
MEVWDRGIMLLDLATRWIVVVSFTPRSLYPPCKEPLLPVEKRGCVGLRVCLDAVEKRTNFSTLADLALACCYTDWNKSNLMLVQLFVFNSISWISIFMFELYFLHAVGSVDGWGTMLQAGRLRFRVPMRSMNLPKPSSRTRPWSLLSL